MNFKEVEKVAREKFNGVARYVRYVMVLLVQVKFQVWAEKEAGLHL